MKDSLFNIDSRLTELYAKAEEMTFDDETGCYFDPETGEVLDLDGEIAALGIDRKKKLTDTALYVTRLTADSETLKARAKAIGERARTKANLADRLKRGIAASMLAFGDKKIESDDVMLTTRQSTSVDILDESVIPEEFIVVKTERNPNKTEIGKALKSGVEVAGAVLKTNTNVIIK